MILTKKQAVLAKEQAIRTSHQIWIEENRIVKPEDVFNSMLLSYENVTSQKMAGGYIKAVSVKFGSQTVDMFDSFFTVKYRFNEVFPKKIKQVG